MAVLDFHVEDPNEKPGNVTTQLVHDAFASVDTEVLSNLVDYIFAKLFISKDTYLSIAVVGEKQMEKIHLEWMDLPGATDVMSFPMDELAQGMLGDIVLCPSVAARQGADAGHSTLDELCLLTTHGILHCLGYDHGTAQEEAEMFGLQRSLLEGFLGRAAPVETRH